jgi:hypothetical protein
MDIDHILHVILINYCITGNAAYGRFGYDGLNQHSDNAKDKTHNDPDQLNEMTSEI